MYWNYNSVNTTVIGPALWKGTEGKLDCCRSVLHASTGESQDPKPQKANKMQPTWTFPKLGCEHVRGHQKSVAVASICYAYQLTISKASLRWAWASTTFYPLLFAFCRPGGKHGRVNRKGSLSEILVLQTIFSSNSSGWVVRQKAEKNLGRQWNREEETQRGRKEKNISPQIINSSETQFRIFRFLTKNSINGYDC